jgi:cytochrome c biogenesis protein CcmG, thiol:disulfide interchange protein DsbE
MIKLVSCVVFLLVMHQNMHAQAVYNIELSDLDGNTITLDEMKGEKLTVLDFWATWCHPCINFIPHLIKLADKFHDKGVNVIGVNEDSPRNRSKVKPFASSLGITYQVLLDTDQELQSNFFIDGLPTLLILDNNGKILYSHTGFKEGDEQIINEEIEKLLTENQ